MSEPNQKEVNERILSELGNLRSEQASIISDNNDLRKMFEDLMKTQKGKEHVPVDESSQNARLPSTFANTGGSYTGQMLSPGYNEQRGSTYFQ